MPSFDDSLKAILIRAGLTASNAEEVADVLPTPTQTTALQAMLAGGGGAGGTSIRPETANTERLSIADLALDPVREPINITSPYSVGTPATNTLVHPSVVYAPAGFAGFKYWMGITPFANGNDQTENPCVYCSNDRKNWAAPAGLTNPIDPTPAGGYNSDTHMYLHTDGYMYLVWRERNTVAAKNRLWGSRSIDGIAWSAKFLMLETVSTTLDFASPSFWHDGTQWVMMAHDIAGGSPFPVKRWAKTGDFLTSWNAVTPTTVTVTHPGALSWWHSSIHRLGSGRLIGIAADYVASGGSLWLWQSDNGTNWAVKKLTSSLLFYRSCLIIEDQAIYAMVNWIAVNSSTGVAESVAPYLQRLFSGQKALLRQQTVSAGLSAGVNIIENATPVAVADGFAGGAQALPAPWVQVDGNTVNRNGSGIALPATTALSRAYVEVGSTEMAVVARFLAYAAGTSYITFRYIGPSDYCRFGVSDATGTLRLDAVVGGSVVESRYITGQPVVSLPMNARVETDGATVSIYINGRLLSVDEFPFNLAGTKAGLHISGSVGNTFDWFTAYSTVQ